MYSCNSRIKEVEVEDWEFKLSQSWGVRGQSELHETVSKRGAGEG